MPKTSKPNPNRADRTEIARRERVILDILGKTDRPLDIYAIAEQMDGIDPLYVIARLRKMESSGQVTRVGVDGQRLLWALATPATRPPPSLPTTVAGELPGPMVETGSVQTMDVLNRIPFGAELSIVGVHITDDGGVVIDLRDRIDGDHLSAVLVT